MKKPTKSQIINILFVLGLIIFAAITLKLPVNWFVIIMPIAICLVFFAILISPEDKENK